MDKYKRFKRELRHFCRFYIDGCDGDEIRAIADGRDSQSWREFWNSYWIKPPSEAKEYFDALKDEHHPLTILANRYMRLAARYIVEHYKLETFG